MGVSDALKLEQSALELDGVSLSFGALNVLDDINLKVGITERRAVLGINGAGKTSLLNLINGDLKATKGHIRFLGKDVTNLPSHERARRGLRRTYQISLLFGGLSILDNLYVAFRGVTRNRYSILRGRRGDAIMDATQDILHTIGLKSVENKLAGEISHGQQRQLEIGMALVGEPRFILFDEPAAGLSPNERGNLIEVLTNLPHHIGYMLIEHDLDVALRVVDKVTMIHGGQIFKESSPSEFETDNDVREIYLGSGYEPKSS